MKSTMNIEEGLSHARTSVPRPQLHKYQSGYTKLLSTWTRYERCLQFFGVTFLILWTLIASAFWSNLSLDIPTSRVNRLKYFSSLQQLNTTQYTALDETTFFVLGDYGTGLDIDKGHNQPLVANALMEVIGNIKPTPSFILSTGDQIYPSGLESTNDPKLQAYFEKMYGQPLLQLPWYITIGNHDCEGSIDAMLQYAAQEQSSWYFPARYYMVDQLVAARTILRIIVLDECDLVCGQIPRNKRCNDAMNSKTSSDTRSQQLQWLERTLQKPNPPQMDRMWKVVVGHWGVYSFAGNADTPELIQFLEPLLKKYGVHAYFSGHDHSMQHVKKHEMNYFIAGAGGYRLHTLSPNARENPMLVHATMRHGFMSVRISFSKFLVQFWDAKTKSIEYTTQVHYSRPWIDDME